MEFMNNKIFKLSLVSSAILATTQVSAALYNVVEVTPSTNYSHQSSFGVAIQPAATTDADDNCFETSASVLSSCSSYKLAGETRVSALNSGSEVDGLSYREEAPFAMDNAFAYIQSESDFENYCKAELGYSTCNSWANPRWNIWSSEIGGSNVPNSIAFTGNSTSGTSLDEGSNLVINSISPSGKAVGISSGLANVSGYRRRSVVAWSEDSLTAPSGLQTRAWASDDTYTAGSIATSAGNDNGTFYTSKAAFWDNSTATAVQIPWENSSTSSVSNRLAQGSIRDFVIDGSTIYAVGYNTYDSSNNYMNATVFSAPKSGYTTASNWTSTIVSNARAKISGDKIHSNSVITSVNKNLVAIGSAKRDGDAPSNGAAPNRLFIIPNVSASTTSLTATFPTGGILFSSAGGKAGAINNYNEIVGQIDFKSTREIDGKPRVKRGFIYPYNGLNSNSTRMARFSNQAWYLDDLTNDGLSSSNNNQFRVIDATDINDAGVISGTALKCSGGYSTTSHNSSCSGTETTVAVKLVPIVGTTASNISARGTDTTSSERSGGSLGLWGIVLLGLARFRRK